KKARGDRSQAEFARFLGILSQATYQRYERGRVPDGMVLHQIATRLGVKMESLLSGEPAKGDTNYAPTMIIERESGRRSLAKDRLDSLYTSIETLSRGLRYYDEAGERLEASKALEGLARELTALLEGKPVTADAIAG